MPASINAVSAIPPAPPAVRDRDREDRAAAVQAEGAATPATAREARLQLNAAIVQASLDVSLSAGNEPLALLYRSAIGQINELLQPEFGPDAIQGAAGQDNTAAGTAARIVSLSTGFFESYKLQHPGEDEAALLQKFMATIRRGFEQGFREAQEILRGLGVLSGSIASGIEQTHELVLRGYEEFEQTRAGTPPAGT